MYDAFLEEIGSSDNENDPYWTSSSKLILNLDLRKSFSDKRREVAIFEPLTEEQLHRRVDSKPVTPPAAVHVPEAPREPFAGGIWSWMRRHRKPLCFFGCIALLTAVGYWGIQYKTYLKGKTS